MKILIISTYFPPLNRMASSRPAAWAQHWSEAGHEVTVLTNKKHPYHGPLSLPLPEFKERVKIVEVDYVLAQKFGYGGKRPLRRILYGWQRLCWIFQASLQAARLSQRQGFDVIVSTYSPPSPIFLGLIARLSQRQSRWVVDYRDLWTGNPYKSRKPWVERLLQGLQRLLISRASLLTTISPPLQAELRKLMPQLRVSVIFNGHDGLIAQTSSAPSDSIIRIVYSGIIYRGKRDPKPLLTAMRKLSDQGKIDLNQFEITFLGDKLADLGCMLQEFDLESIARLPGQVSRQEAIQTQRKADLLLLLGGDDPGVLPGKLFEYIAACRPILAIGDSAESDVGQLLKRTGCGRAVGMDPEFIEQTILGLASGEPLCFFTPNLQEIELCSRRRQSAKLEAEMLELVNQ